MSLAFAEIGKAQASGNSNAPEEAAHAAREGATDSTYMVFDATPAQEAALRAQIRLMHPEVLPLRVFFCPTLEIPG